MDTNYVGIYQLLSTHSIWLTGAILFLVVILFIPTGRLLFENHFYQASKAALHGYMALIVMVLIGVHILHGKMNIPFGLNDAGVQRCVVFLLFFLGFFVSVMTLQSRDGRVMDVYHDLIVAPLMVFLALMLLPIIWMSGNEWAWKVSVMCVAVWAIAALGDIFAGRINQREHLRNHEGIKFPGDPD